jgi:solute carrier family 8 (sodium/calcium exchanger)
VDLKLLLPLLAHCQKCTSPASADIRSRGTLLVVDVECSSPACGLRFTWRNQSYIGAIPEVSLRLSSAVLYSGSLPTKSLRMLGFLGVGVSSLRTFARHQKEILHPCLAKAWKSEQQLLLSAMRAEGQPAILGGDGRADSPGHCAKFGSYCLMDLRRGKIVDVQLVQVSSTYTILCTVINTRDLLFRATR